MLSKNTSNKVRIAIIGCGAITESAHLPAVLACPDVELTGLADTNEGRARFLQDQFGLGPIATKNYRTLLDRTDAVILALPNDLHARIGIDCLNAGVHVLCEKPLASTVEESQSMCQAARKTSTALAVGYVTRFFPSTSLTRRLLDSRFLGKPISFDYEFGTRGGWSTVSGYNLRRSSCGGGVLVVSGSHFVDRMLYLFDDVKVQSYTDDSRGGVEANCVAQFSATSSGVPVTGRVTLSKTHQLGNRLMIRGENGILRVGEGEKHTLTYFPSSDPNLQMEISSLFSKKDEENYFRVQLEDFAEAIRSGNPPLVDGEQGTKSVALMQSCYDVMTRLDEPWCDLTMDRLKAALMPAGAPVAPQPTRQPEAATANR